MERNIERYHIQGKRDMVDFDVHYVAGGELLEACAADAEADILICDEELMAEALEDGLAYGGDAETSVRNLGRYNSHFSMKLVRKKGSGVEMPDTRLVSGEESGTETRLRYLGTTSLTVAVLPEDTWEGRAFRSALNVSGYGLYSEERGTGGTFADELDGQIIEAASVKSALKMLKRGEVDLAAVYGVDIEGIKGVEVLYDVPSYGWTPSIKGASVASSADGAVARDFLQFFALCD